MAKTASHSVDILKDHRWQNAISVRSLSVTVGTCTSTPLSEAYTEV